MVIVFQTALNVAFSGEGARSVSEDISALRHSRVHIQARGSWREDHRVTRASLLRREFHDSTHSFFGVRAICQEDRNFGGMLIDGACDLFPVHPQQRDCPELLDMVGDKLVDLSALEPAARNPHDLSFDTVEGRVCRMGVGRFGIVDPVDAVVGVNYRSPVPRHFVGVQCAVDLFRGGATGNSHSRSGQRIERAGGTSGLDAVDTRDLSRR